MHQQYVATRDVKFPDCKQYTKPGDVLLFNNSNSTLSIYRCDDLIGTVRFSHSGLQEFLKLGWITKPTDKTEDKKKPQPKTKKTAEPIPVTKPKIIKKETPKLELPVSAPEPTAEPIKETDEPIKETAPEAPLSPIKFKGKKSFSEERTVDTPEPKVRKTKKS